MEEQTNQASIPVAGNPLPFIFNYMPVYGILETAAESKLRTVFEMN